MTDNDYPDDWDLDLTLPRDPYDPWGDALDPWRPADRSARVLAYTAAAEFLHRNPAAWDALASYAKDVTNRHPDAKTAFVALVAALGVLDAVACGATSIGAADRIAQLLADGPTPIPIDDEEDE